MVVVRVVHMERRVIHCYGVGNYPTIDNEPKGESKVDGMEGKKVKKQEKSREHTINYIYFGLLSPIVSSTVTSPKAHQPFNTHILWQSL
jgi:hypothetical protein